MKTKKIFGGILLLSMWHFSDETKNAQHIETEGKFISQIPDYGQADMKRVDEFLREFKKFTFHIFSREKRTRELDNRIRNARLNLADKIEAFKRLAPPVDSTGHRDELRMERMLFSVAPADLSLFKFVLEYDGDYKDMVEYIFSDIDDKECQCRIIKYLRTVKQQAGIKVLTDVDDTMYPNLIDDRYPVDDRCIKASGYPGVLEFYDSLKHEPFDLQIIPITTLSARPNPIAGVLEEGSLKRLAEFKDSTGIRLCPSALSGDLGSSFIGTAETLLREKLDSLHDKIPHGQEDKIGRVKFENFEKFSKVYPEYRYVFIGDSGQADALTAQLMITNESTEGASRIVTTFTHNLRESAADPKSLSPAFRSLRPDIIISKTSDTGRGVIIFRNYIDAAVSAYIHSKTLGNLVTSEELAGIIRSALIQFQKIDFQGKEASGKRLREQYRQDAEESYKLLTAKSSSLPPETLKKLKEIRSILDKKFPY